MAVSCNRRCVARTARRTTRERDARPETFSRESRAEKLEETPEGRIDCVRCEVVPPPKPAQRAHTTGGLVRRRVSALHTAPDHGEGAHPHSRTLQQLCLRGLRSSMRVTDRVVTLIKICTRVSTPVYGSTNKKRAPARLFGGGETLRGEKREGSSGGARPGDSDQVAWLESRHLSRTAIHRIFEGILIEDWQVQNCLSFLSRARFGPHVDQ